MEPNQRAALIDTLETAFAQQGVKDIYGGAQWLTAFLDLRRPHIAAAQSREALDAYLDSLGSVDAAYFQQVVALLMAVGPILQQFLFNAAQQTVEAQPRPPGPPVRITPQQKRDVVDYISKLFFKGVSIGDAQRRSVQHFGCSLRSIQRIWQQRKELAKQPFLSMDDVWKFLIK